LLRHGAPLAAAFLAAVFFGPHLFAADAPTFDAPQFVNTAHKADNMVMGDFDGDGVPDVATLDASNGKVDVHYGDGSGGFTDTVATFTITSSNSRYRGIAAADLDGDGQWELIFAAGSSVSIYDQQNDGSFTNPQIIDLTATGISATKVAVGNLTTAPTPTTDGSRDIVVCDDFGSVGVVWISNDGLGNFGTPTAYAAGGCAFYARPIAKDVDGDGLDDVVLAHRDFANSIDVVGVLLNKGNGTLDTEDKYSNSTLAGFTEMGLAVADVDDDGKPDLVTTGYVHSTSPLKDTFYLNVNLSNGNGTFADGKAFQFTLNNGANISAIPIDAADVNGDGRADILTVDLDPGGTGFTGFTVTEWTGMGAALAVARQTNFSTNDGIACQSIVLGYDQNDGTSVNFNNDSGVDVLIGTAATISGTPAHSKFAVFRNTTPFVPTGRNIEFVRTNLNVSEGDPLSVKLVRGSDSTGQAAISFSVGGTATQKGYEANGQTADYEITDPPNQTQTVVFNAANAGTGAPEEHTKTIEISTFGGKSSESVQSIVLTLLPETLYGAVDLGAKSVATVAIIDDSAAALGKAGGLKVVPSNVVKPVPAASNIPADVKVVGRTGADWSFSVSQSVPDDAVDPKVKVQFSVAPPASNQWHDYLTLVHGKGSNWSGKDRHPLVCNKIYFRTAASADGYPTVFGPPTQPFAVIGGPDLGLNISAKSDSDPSGITTRPNEVITYHFNIFNRSADAAAMPAVLTAPIPAHSTYLTATAISGQLPTEIKDTNGKTRMISWSIPSLGNVGSLDGDLLVTTDPADAFATDKKHPNGAGYVFIEGGSDKDKVCILSAPTQGVRVPAPQELRTEILGSLKISVAKSTGTVSPGGLITYTFTCENNSAQDIANLVVTDDLPQDTEQPPVMLELAALYSFVNGNADTNSPVLPNPGPSSNPAIIYMRTSVAKPNIDIFALQPLPTSATQLKALRDDLHRRIDPILAAKPGFKILPPPQKNPSLPVDFTKPNPLAMLSPYEISILIKDGFIEEAGVQWTMPSIPHNSSRNVSVTVRLPYDAPAVDQGGNLLQIVDGHFDKTGKYIAGYDFINPGQSISALYGDQPPATIVNLQNVAPTAAPHLLLAKSARGDANLNDPNFPGNGFSRFIRAGNLVAAVQGRGVDYVLTYYNDLDPNGQGADAHNVILHDVIPAGMTLQGSFKQVTGNPQTSGQLVAGQAYYITRYQNGDDFTNLMSYPNPYNGTGVTFTAQGNPGNPVTPTNWTHGSSINLAPVPMNAAQFTFYDAFGQILSGIDPASTTALQPKMGFVRSMDIRLDDVSLLTVLPKNTTGFVEYTCSPYFSSTTPFKPAKNRPVLSYFYDFANFAGTVHSYGGFVPTLGPSDPGQGFYLESDDLLSKVSGGPDNLVVQVAEDVSFSDVSQTVGGELHPGDVGSIELTFSQNGDVSTTNTSMSFVVPKGVTFLNDANHHPLLMDKNNGVVTNQTTVTATQTGSTVNIALGTVTGGSAIIGTIVIGGVPQPQITHTVRVWFQVNPGPHLDPALVFRPGATLGSFLIDAHMSGNYIGVHNFRSNRIARGASAQTTPTATSGANVPNVQRVAEVGSPHLGIHRNAPKFVAKNSTYTLTITASNTGNADATGVHVGMQIPFGARYAGVGHNATVGNKPVSPIPTFLTHDAKGNVVPGMRGKVIADQSGSGPDILDWPIGTLPANSDFVVDVMMTADSHFPNPNDSAHPHSYPITDHSAFVSAENVGKIHIDADELVTNVGDSEDVAVVYPDIVASDYLIKNHTTLNLSLKPQVKDLAATFELAPIPMVSSYTAVDVLVLPASSVTVIPKGNDQVIINATGTHPIISHDGGTLTLPNGQQLLWKAGVTTHIVAAGGGNILANDGATIVASGGGNLITITGIPNIGDKNCSDLLDDVANIVASGGGNIVASGAGNLVSTNGGNLISNHPGGGFIGNISQITVRAIKLDGTSQFIGTVGNAIAAGLLNQDGSSLLPQGGAAAIMKDVSGVMSFTAGVISNDGGS
jgi:uncharacterized repeat protein (TIGR01451 family)